MADFLRETPKAREVSPSLAKASGLFSESPNNRSRQSDISPLVSIEYGLGPLDGDNPPTVGTSKDNRKPEKPVTLPPTPPRDSATGLRTPSSFSNLVNQGILGKDVPPNIATRNAPSVNRLAETQRVIGPGTVAKEASKLPPRREPVITLKNRPAAAQPKQPEISSDIDNILEIHGSVKNDKNFIDHARAEIGKLPGPVKEALTEHGVKIIIGQSMDALAADGTLAKHGGDINVQAGGNIKADGSPMSLRYTDGSYDPKSHTVLLTRDVAQDVKFWNPQTRQNETILRHVSADRAFKVTNHLSNILGHEVSHALDDTDPKGRIAEDPAIIAAHAADVIRLTADERKNPLAYQYIVQDENPRSGRTEAVGYMMPTILMNKDVSGRWTKGELQTKFPNTYKTISNLIRTRQYGRDLTAGRTTSTNYRLR